MLKQDYYAIRKRLTQENAFEVNNLYGAVTVFVEALCLTVGFIALTQVPYFSWMYWGIQLFLGISLYRCYVILHECGHNTLFQQKTWNTLVGCLMSPFCFHPYISWREIHHDHHKWVGIVDRDHTEKQWLKLRDSPAIWQNLLRLLWKLWLPLGTIQFVFDVYWLYPIQQFKQHREGDWKAGFAVMIVVLPHSILMALLGIPNYLILVAPMILVFFLYLEGIALPLHGGLFPFLSHDHPQPIPYLEQDAVTRTIELPPILAVLLVYNFNLHTEHHLFPNVPWYNLPKVKQALQNVDHPHYTAVPFLPYTLDIRDRDPVELFIHTLPDKV